MNIWLTITVKVEELQYMFMLLSLSACLIDKVVLIWIRSNFGIQGGLEARI
jgi:hypothetical protein